jgi:hypothetical protein
VVPQLKYPANPPSVGAADTIDRRTALYFIMIAISLAAGVLAIGLARRISERVGGWNAVLLAMLAFVLVVAVAGFVLPEVGEVPPGFSAVVLWRFRIASLGIQAVLWGTLGIVFGIAAEQSLGSHQTQRRTSRLALR